MKKFKWLLGVLVWAAVLVPFFLGASAAHPATDDFTFAAYTHTTWLQTGSILHVLKDAVSYALRTWRDWQGTVTGVLIMTLNPAVFSLEHYGVHAVILLVLHLLAWLVFLAHVLGRRMGLPKSAWIPMALISSAISLVDLPDMVEGIYWFNGAWFYMGAQAVALLTLVSCDRFSESKAGTKTKVAWAILCGLLLFALGMDNYITAMMTGAILAMMVLQRLWASHKTPESGMVGVTQWQGEKICAEELRPFGGQEEKRLQMQAAIRTAWMLLPLGVGLVLSVVAPGNHVRMETDGAHQAGLLWLEQSLLWTARDAGKYLIRFSVKTPMLALLVAGTPWLCKQIQKIHTRPEKTWRCPPMVCTVLGTYLILCAMIVPHMYSSGYAGSGRVVNMYHSFSILMVPIAYCMLLLRLSPNRREKLMDRLTKKRCLAWGAVLLMLCLGLGQHKNYVKLVRDQREGTQTAYTEQFKREYALCETADAEDTVELPVWTVQTVTGKPTAYEDETMWTNEAMAHFFGVKRVKVVSDGDSEENFEEGVIEATVIEATIIEENAMEENAIEENAIEEKGE